MGELIPKDFFELKASNSKYWMMLKEQIEKDFQRIGSRSVELELFDFRKWTETIGDACKSLDESRQLENFLYILDLPENWSVNLKFSDNYYSDLAQAIIQREWAKIYYRMNY